MTIIRFCLFALGLILAGAEIAQGHFLFIRLKAPAEGGRFAEVYFSDRADAGDPKFVGKIAHAKLWMQARPGVFEALTVHTSADRLRALVPASGAVSVIGECTYGVLARPKKTPFLLRYYPKAISGDAAEMAKLQARPKTPFEIQVRPKGDALEFVALRHGKPVPKAEFIGITTDLKDHQFRADASGRAAWKPASSGYFAVYTSQTLKEVGVHNGQKYEEIREFATVSFAWPLQTQQPDTAAVRMFQEAMAARASWNKFPGFAAEVRAYADGRVWKSALTVSAKGNVDMEREDEVVAPWVREQMESMVLHRVSRPQSKPPVLRFADDEIDHPLGRLVIFQGGKFASSYRVKDRQIMVVNRLLGKTNMTITVLDNDLNADKKFLPRTYTVQYWDGKTGGLKRVETIQNRWTRLGSWDLPAQITVVTSASDGQGVKTMTLSKHRVLK
ncbi:MAG: DUF3386 family protein [Planctomycetes bacterium]|nr:DUF3386 family protein [Planctomycetota bacterium]